MNKLTYKEAYDKIIQAYFNDEIIPFDPKFCFCGTLCDNSQQWFRNPTKFHNNFLGYKGEDFVKMETALFRALYKQNSQGEWYGNRYTKKTYEDVLFKAMCAALEVLKEIHRKRGEDVDSVPVFEKRQLVK
jgi:hypothetical protein